MSPASPSLSEFAAATLYAAKRFRQIGGKLRRECQRAGIIGDCDFWYEVASECQAAAEIASRCQTLDAAEVRLSRAGLCWLLECLETGDWSDLEWGK